MYGLKQVPRAWHEKIDYFLISFGFRCCESNHNIYVLHVHGDTLIMTLYVYYVVIIPNNVDLVLGLKEKLVDTFEMIDTDLLHFPLSIQVFQMLDYVFLSQPKYVMELLEIFKMDDCKLYATHL